MGRQTKEMKWIPFSSSLPWFMLITLLSFQLECQQNHGFADAFQLIPNTISKTIQVSSLSSTPKRRNFGYGKQIASIKENLITSKIATTTCLNAAKPTVTFANPLLEEGYPPAVAEFQQNTLSSKPLLLYVPGFDGTNVAPFLQYPELSTIFDVRCMTVDMSDRSTFEELRDGIVEYLEETLLFDEQVKEEKIDEDMEEEKKGGAKDGFLSSLFGAGGGNKKNNKPQKSNRPIYIMGESFGGILALEVALSIVSPPQPNKQQQPKSKIDLRQNLKGLVLINPATCYDRSRLASQGPSVVSLPPLLYPLGVLGLIPLFTDDYALPQLGLILSSKALPSVIDTPERESYMGRIAFSLPSKLKYMPQETLEWRLEEWLRRGCEDISMKLKDISDKQVGVGKGKIPPVLLVAGEKDGTLPSIAEAERLLGILPDCTVHVVEGAGHACTCGSRVDLAALMRGRFKELRQLKKGEKSGRIAMKQVAADGEGIYFGLEPRYDGANVGLSPLEYWSEKNYRKLEE